MNSGELEYSCMSMQQQVLKDKELQMVSWQFEDENRNEIIYDVIDVNQERIRLREPDGNFIGALEHSGGLEIVEFQSIAGDSAMCSLNFNPSLPDMGKIAIGEKAESRFTISIREHKGVMAGIVKMSRNENNIKINFEMLKPKWANARSIFTSINISNNKIVINSEIKNNAIIISPVKKYSDELHM